MNGFVELPGCESYGKVGLFVSECCLVEKLQKAVFFHIPGKGRYLVLIIAKNNPMGQYFNLLPGRFIIDPYRG